MGRLSADFYARDCLKLAPDLVGKVLVHRLSDGRELRARISETEAYRGIEDSACHAHKGMTERNKLLWENPGTVYIYLCYGIHWLLNVISGQAGQPQGVLIRACDGYPGPGRLTKYLLIDKSLNGSSFVSSESIWIEDDGFEPRIVSDKRVGISYAAKEDQEKPWRFKSAGAKGKN